MDYRRLNAKTKVDAYLMPRIDDLIDNLGKARYISTLHGFVSGLLAGACGEDSSAKDNIYNIINFGL